ncbi:MAG: AAA family ATPase, partial [Thermoproteota archaeon]
MPSVGGSNLKTAEPWTSKYKPLSRREIVGNESSVRHVFEWLKGWEKNRTAILLYGPPGVGKTASVEAISRELDYNLLEMNASEIRTEDKINELILPALSSK